MILQALTEYYERKREADPDAFPELGFERKEISFLIVLSEEGRFLNLEDTREGERRKQRGRRFTVPQGEKRTGTKGWQKAFLLWDHVGYVLGAAVGGKSADKAALQHGAFLERISGTFGQQPDDVGVRAVLRFLEKGDLSGVFKHPLWQEVQGTPGANLSFRLAKDTRIVPERRAVVQAVRDAVSAVADDAAQAQCLVTGERGPIATLHPVIKGVQGAQPTGANIVSFNLDAFRTHARSQGANAPVSERAVFAYTTALNRLLDRNSRLKAHVGDTTVVFWSAEGNPVEDLVAALFRDDQKALDDPEQGVERLRQVFTSPWQGHPPVKDDRSHFYILGLAPNSSRISIRFWHRTTVAAFAKAVLQHFGDIHVARPDWLPSYPSIRALLKSTAVLGKEENIPPNLAGAVLESVLTGRPYPRTLLSAAVQRVRTEPEAGPGPWADRMAIIKGCLVRDSRTLNSPHREVDVSLDPANKNVGYVLGRLFATLERVQDTASPGIQSGIRERYYASASATPVAAFPTLMKLKNHHLRKIESRGAVINLERLIGSITADVTDFPAVLSLADQGRFALGYYHQRQDFFTSKKAEAPEEASHV